MRGLGWMPTTRYISKPGGSESRPPFTYCISLRKMCRWIGTSMWWPGLSGSCMEEDVNVVQSSEQEARGGASLTALAPPVLALELIDLLRTHAERLAVVPDARAFARKEPQERIREQAHEEVERRGALLDG